MPRIIEITKAINAPIDAVWRALSTYGVAPEASARLAEKMRKLYDAALE